MSQYEIVIGLEVHLELRTKTKAFCSCPNAFGDEPNTHVCPVCLGLPGVLPVINQTLLDYAVRVGLALDCQIASFSKFDRKNYYYPDLPKAYQISQFDLPLCRFGKLEINAGSGPRMIGITRVHMEEDAGKLVHGQGLADYSLVDLNRAGVPLLEIVSEPDLRTPEEAKAYLEKLKMILHYLDISDCKMEEGSLRCDANISIRQKGSDVLNPKVEIKNLNSFRSVQRALEGEFVRQSQIYDNGEMAVNETRGWDENRGTTVVQRTKEEASDYRYFPDPDLAPIVISPGRVEEVRDALPELPDPRKQRFISQYGLPPYDAAVLTGSRQLADFYEVAVDSYHDPKTVSNWVMGELLRLLKIHNQEVEELKLTPVQLVEMLELIDKGTISGKIAKTVFEEMFDTGKCAWEIIDARGLVQISDEGQITTLVEQVLAAHPEVVADFHKGKDKAFAFLVGQIMKATKGKANPQLVNRLIKERI